MMSSLTIWFTGLSSAGKSTLSETVAEWARGRGYSLELLDGDMMRRSLWRDLGFSKHDREENIRRIGFVDDLLGRNGITVLVSAISPYRAIRDELRTALVILCRFT